MPDSDNDKNPQTPGPKKSGNGEMPMESRLLLAFVLMGLVLFGTQYFFKPPVTPKPVTKVQTPSPQQAAKPAVPEVAPVPVAEAAEHIAGQKEEEFTVETDVYRIVFSNRGAVVKSWLLKNYKNEQGKPLEVVNAAAAQKAGYPFSLMFKGQNPSTDVNQALYAPKPAADGLGIDYEFSNGKTTARKTFQFQRNSYLSQITTEVRENGIQIPHLIAWRGGFGDASVVNAASVQHTLHYDLTANKLIVNEAKSAKDGPVLSSGSFSFAGMEDTFFAAVVLPKSGKPLEIETVSDSIPSPADPSKEEARVGAEVGGDGQNELALFLGPKDMDLLRRVDPKLENIVDFGWFAFIAKPLFLSLNWVNDKYVHNYGWSIVVVTIIINMLLLPLKFTSMRSMKKMQTLQPQIAAINKKYENVGIRDPRKAEQNQEVMELYKRNGVNPMGGCLPMVLQIPFFIAYYKVLSVSIEMRGAQWLWVSDLSQPEKLAIHILPILMVITQFALQKMTPNATADPAQQKVMMLMPLMMAFFFYNAQSGLVLYWLTGNVVGVVQQLFFNRIGNNPATVETTVVKSNSVLKSKKKPKY
jgi:YidC/Oxa1 family membrane protein insertase